MAQAKMLLSYRSEPGLDESMRNDSQWTKRCNAKVSKRAKLNETMTETAEEKVARNEECKGQMK